LTANSNPSRRHGDDGGGGGGAGYDSGGGSVKYVLSWKRKSNPKAIVGAEPYAQSSVQLMGFKMEVQLYSALGNGSCFHIAFCTAMHLLLKDVNMDVLSQHLTVAEATTASRIAAIGKDIVQFESSIDEDVKGLISARPFREILDEHLRSKQEIFLYHFVNLKTEDYGGEQSNSSKTRKKRWIVGANSSCPMTCIGTMSFLSSLGICFRPSRFSYCTANNL